MPEITFEDLRLIEPLQKALTGLGYATPTPIQAQAIPPLLEGRDLLGCAQTGTGKTAAFALPLLQRLYAQRPPLAPRAARVLVLTPTRELAHQVADSFRSYGRHLGLRLAVVYGGVGQTPQVRACARGVDVLVATPGRLLDLMNQGCVRLDRLAALVLDEADRMLDMGFLPDIRRVLAAVPAQRQTLLFSATMPQGIARLADSLLTNPAKVKVTPEATPVERIAQKVLFVAQGDKRALLGEVLKDDSARRVLVFTRTKHGANRVAKQLAQMQVRADAIHGDKSQNARQAALENFRSGGTRVLVATDLAARGIDVEGVTHVINYDLPMDPESYVHRIGRTGRAGAAGVAISFCDSTERTCLRAIERLIRQSVPVDQDHPYPQAGVPQPAPARVAPLARHRTSRPARHGRRSRAAA
ncbi:MAG: DEAD/DEAH box helicase [Desulfarculus sp.]|nr:DEAD/DEAH box helicase [Desulfarculus sp.]